MNLQIGLFKTKLTFKNFLAQLGVGESLSLKLPPNLLSKYVFSRVGMKDPDVLVGPSYGEDAAIIRVGGKLLVVHCNPITGAIENIGWLAVHIACNDIAVRGARPRWVLPVIYLPFDTTEREIDEITRQVDVATKELNVMVVGGHTEYTYGLNRIMIAMTAMGVCDEERYIITGGAKPGDLVLMTKAVAIEGTSILASDFEKLLKEKGVSQNIIEKAKEFVKEISVVKEALLLSEVGVNSMHDPTEGGIIGGLAEIAYASKVAIKVWESKMLVRPETKIICKTLGVDSLRLISSGVLLATAAPKVIEESILLLREHGIECRIIGEVKEGEGLVVVRESGIVEKYGPYVEDELLRIWKESGH